MRIEIILTLSAVLLFSPACGIAGESSPTTRPTGVAVVELFTSEGCSSCPPADDLLGNLVNESSQQGTQVFALSFHVDYWNQLGWKDRFSDPAYSQRQRDYAALAHTRQVYTPQMIVNGSPMGFVGSDETAARQHIKKAVSQPTTAAIELKRAVAGPKVTLAYTVTGETAGAVLNVALIERLAETEVVKGENAGRKLSHHNVVRSLKSADLKSASGQLAFELPAGLKPENASLVAFVQDSKSGAVRGAQSAGLN